MGKSKKKPNEFDYFLKDFLVQLCVFLLDMRFPLCSFVIIERIPISGPLTKFHSGLSRVLPHKFLSGLANIL